MTDLTGQLPTAAQRRIYVTIAEIEDETGRRATLREVAVRRGLSVAAVHEHVQVLADACGLLLRVGRGYQTIAAFQHRG